MICIHILSNDQWGFKIFLSQRKMDFANKEENKGK